MNPQPQTAEAQNLGYPASHVVETVSANLLGATITGTVSSACGEFAGIRVHHPIRGEFTVWIDRDPEGNGCGSLSVQFDDAPH